MEIDGLQSKPVQKLMDAIRHEHGVCGTLFLGETPLDPITTLCNYNTYDKTISIRATGAGGMPPKRGGNVKPTIVKQKTSDQEDNNSRAKGVKDRYLFLTAKVADGVQNPGNISNHSKIILKIASDIYDKSDYFSTFINGVSDLNIAENMVKEWDNRKSKNAATFARSLSETYIKDLTGFARSYELLCDAFEAAFTAEFFNEDDEVFNQIKYKSMLDAKVQELKKRDADELEHYRRMRAASAAVPGDGMQMG